MKLLTFLAERFSWTTHSRTLEQVPELQVSGSAEEAVVVFLHAEERDEHEQASRRALRRVTKHVKWLAGKRGMRRVVLHSFTHLGGANADPAFAGAFMEQVAERLENAGYEVQQTPFGHFCSWELAVYGESLAKVWKEI